MRYLRFSKLAGVSVCVVCFLSQARGANPCTAADGLRDAGFLEEAQKAYLALLEKDPAPSCATEGLALVGKSLVRSKLELGDSLRQAGEDADALAAYKVALQLDPTSREAVQAVRATRPVPWAVRAGIAFALFVTGYLLIDRFGRRTLRIEDLDTQTIGPAPFGKEFADIVRAQLRRLATGTVNDRIQIVTGPVEDVSLPADIGAAVPEAVTNWLSPVALIRFFTAVLRVVSLRRGVTLKMTLHKLARHGLGMTGQLFESNRILASETIFLRQFDDASSQDDVEESLHQLAEYVAIWLMFELHDRYSAGFNLLGTRRWREYAYFRAGIHATDQGRDKAARDLYIRALRLEPMLRAARINLGMALWRTGDTAFALEQLARAERDAKRATDGALDLARYSAMYDFAKISYDLNDLDGAAEKSRELLDLIHVTMRSLKANRSESDQQFARQISIIRPIVAVMRGGLMVEQGKLEGRDLILAEVDPPNVSSKLQYNLACSFSILAKNDSQGRNDYLEESIRHLERALLLTPRYERDARTDRSLQPVRDLAPQRFQQIIDRFRPEGAP